MTEQFSPEDLKLVHEMLVLRYELDLVEAQTVLEAALGSSRVILHGPPESFPQLLTRAKTLAEHVKEGEI